MNKIRDLKTALDTLLNNAKCQNNADDVKRISELIYMHNFQNENLTYPQKSRVEKLCKKIWNRFFLVTNIFLISFFRSLTTK